jgi:hypothetical protein
MHVVRLGTEAATFHDAKKFSSGIATRSVYIDAPIFSLMFSASQKAYVVAGLRGEGFDLKYFGGEVVEGKKMLFQAYI